MSPVREGPVDTPGLLRDYGRRIRSLETHRHESPEQILAKQQQLSGGLEYATVVIAAANTRDGASRANVVCSGGGDDATVKNAIFKYCPIIQEGGQDVLSGRVLLLEGDYHFTGGNMDLAFILACSGFEFAGLGGGTVIHVGEVEASTAVSFTNGPATSSRGVTVRDLYVKNHEFYAGFGVYLSGGYGPDESTQNLVSNVTVENPWDSAIIVGGIGGMVRDSTVWGVGNPDTGTVRGIVHEGPGGSIIGNRVLRKATDVEPLAMEQAIYTNDIGTRILSNEVTTGNRGIEVNGECLVEGNYLHDDTATALTNQGAIMSFGSGDRIKTNLIVGWSQNGILLGGGEDTSCDDNTVIDRGNLSDPSTQMGIEDQGTKNQLRDNTVRGGYNYGMRIAGTDAMVRDNDLRDSGTTANYQDDGVGTNELGSMF